MGFGLDCSSASELILGRQLGFRGEQIMFSSNDTARSLLDLSAREGGCILNLDDITLIDAVQPFPELICFRYNPGARRTGNQIIGVPVEAKYGVTYDQIVQAYRQVRERGAKRFGIHTMIISNERDYRFMVETVKMLENKYKGLIIGGNLRNGIGMADRIQQGRSLAKGILNAKF